MGVPVGSALSMRVVAATPATNPTSGQVLLYVKGSSVYMKTSAGVETLVGPAGGGGTLAVTDGGTGATTLASGKFLVGNGTSPVTATKTVPGGDVVGTTDSQTLTNKTLSRANNLLNGFVATSMVVSDASGALATLPGGIPSGDIVGTTASQSLSNKDFGVSDYSLVTDWNAVIKSGFYFAQNGSANSPNSGYSYQGIVEAASDNFATLRLRQRVTGTDGSWVRTATAPFPWSTITWTAWEKTYERQSELDSRYAATQPFLNRGRAANQTISSSVWTILAHDTELQTAVGITGTAGTYTVPADGVYQIEATVSWAANSTGRRATAITINGTNQIVSQSQPSATGGQTDIGAPVSGIWRLSAGDTVAISVWQNAGTLAVDGRTDGNGVQIYRMGA